MNSHSITRRKLLLGVAALPLMKAVAAETKPAVCFFSKPMHGLDWQHLARAVKQVGCSGVDLTVRPGGHVLPERVREDLPKAVEAIRAEGLEVPMITTELLSTRDPAAEPTLATVSKLGIPCFKPGYYKYKFADVRAELLAVAADFRGLAGLALEKRIRVGYHNHTGYVGAPVWDIEQMLTGLDPQWAGYYFDPAHATAEGGGAGWKIALNRIAPRIFMTAIKDFTWERNANRTGWRERWCPLGEGMVDLPAYFRELSRSGFHGPISLHIEYEITGANAASRDDNLLAAAKRDMDFLVKAMRPA